MKKNDEIRLVFLGGVGEIGMNCLAIETPDGIVVVDCGVMFPEGRYFGPDLIIPDLRYFRANRDRIKGVVITHGHEDHIGAVPVVFGEMPVTVYAPPYAVSLIKEKTQEYTKTPAFELKRVAPGDKIEVAGLEFEFFRVTHSIPDALALAIRTPHGLIVHTGDFRVDDAPSLGEPFDREKFARLGDEGVLLMLSDSTNVERSGTNRSEQWVADNVMELAAGHPGRILVSMFSSNVERISLFAKVARKTGRKLGLVGRSLFGYTRAAMETGYSPFDPNELVDPYFADELPGQSLMILVAGSQGEPRSSLTRVSTGEHSDVNIRPGDMVIYSSKIIPGNEKGILRVSNALTRLGAEVYHEGNSSVHTSGHAMQDELAGVLELVRPRYFIPVHGEYRFLVRHAALAEDTVKAKSLIADWGHVIALGKNRLERVAELDLKHYYIERPLVGNAEELKLNERRKLLFNGLVTVQAKLGKGKRGLSVKTAITLHGVPDPDGTLVEAINDKIQHEFVNRKAEISRQQVEEAIKVLTRRVVKKRQSRKPLVQVIIEGK